MNKISIILFLCFLCPVMYGQVAQNEATPPPNEQRPPIIPFPKEVKPVLEGEPIEVAINIQGARPDDQITLYFREKGTFEFNALPMGYNPETHLYEATIDERFHARNMLEYYIEMFPVGLSAIRIPANPEKFSEIVTYRNKQKIIRAFLIALLIASPALIAFIVGRIYKLHTKRATMYQQKLNARKRQLAKAREKHYKDYWRKMTGVKKPGAAAEPGAKKSGIQTEMPQNHETSTLDDDSFEIDSEKFADELIPDLELSLNANPSREPDLLSDTGELQRELDVILSAKKETSKPPEKTSLPPRRPAPPQNGRSRVDSSKVRKPGPPLQQPRPQTAPRKTQPPAEKPSPPSSALSKSPAKPIVQAQSKTQSPPQHSPEKVAQIHPIPPQKIETQTAIPEKKMQQKQETRPVKPTEKPSETKPTTGKSGPSATKTGDGLDKTESKKLEKNERDQLLDILGLDL